MKNTNNENIPKSFDKKERIEQNNFKNKTEKSAKNNDPENVQNEQNSINIEKLGVEYNFEIFKDNEDLFNSDKDSLSSPSNNKQNNENYGESIKKSKTMEISNTFLIYDNNDTFLNPNIKRKDYNDIYETNSFNRMINYNNNNLLFPLSSQSQKFNQNLINNNYNYSSNLINQCFNNNFSLPMHNNEINIFNNNRNFYNTNYFNFQRLNQTYSKYNFNKKITNSYYLEIYFIDLENELKKENFININIFKKIKQDLLNIITNQNGSKILSKYLSSTPSQIIHLIYKEIENNLICLFQDSYGNYFCTQLFCLLDNNDRFNYLNIITNNIIILSLNKIATYPTQFIIGKLKTRNEKQMILQPIKLNLQKLSLDVYGTHVLEKIIMTFETEYCYEIFNFIVENLIFLSNHANGLCLVKKILVIQYKKEYYQIIKEKLKEKAFKLVQNPYGNYALQIVIDNWTHEDIIHIFQQFFGNCTELSIMKFSSNVIERLIEKSQVFIDYFIKETCINKKTIGLLIKNNFGNYVIQTALKYTKGNNKMILVNSIENNLGILGDKKLINKWKNIISSSNPKKI